VGLGELVQPLPAELAADAAGVEPAEGRALVDRGSRFGSQSSWDEFTQWQWVTARPQAHGFPF
jgi:hypothetical protein